MNLKSNLKNFINSVFKIFLALIPSKPLRAKLKADWTKFFIKKYVNIAFINYSSAKETIIEPSPVIYQYWDQGEKRAPLIIKKCYESVEKFEPDLKRIILDKDSIEDYIEIPSYIYDLKNKGKIKLPQFSDILRSCILAKGGAVWVDSSIYLTGGFPSYVRDSDFFIFKGIDKTPENFKGANYFIWAKTKNAIMEQVKEAILEYWKDNDFLVSYFTHPHFISLVADKNPDVWNKIPTKNQELTLLMSKVLFNPYDEEKYLNIVKQSSIHKLTYKIPTKVDISHSFYDKILNL